MAKKDPAFLFYSNSWIQGTSSLMPDEKGIYIDLLCHQHQNKDLPNDTRRLAKMCGISEDEFLKLWVVVKEKFEVNSVNRLVNRKLTEVVTERSTKSSTNKVIGQFASILRLSNMTDEMKEKLKKEFKVGDFLGNSDRTVKERLTEWLHSRSESIKNTNSISIYKEVKNSENGKSKKEFINFKAQPEELLAERYRRHEEAVIANGKQNN
jgi:uncharacterized protein YdaU (DUF1376 family)